MHHRHYEDIRDDLRDQIASLSQEVEALRKQVGKRGKNAYRETRHMGEEAADWISEYAGSALPEVRRSAYQLQQSAREHPGTTASLAAAGLVALCVAAVLLMRR